MENLETIATIEDGIIMIWVSKITHLPKSGVMVGCIARTNRGAIYQNQGYGGRCKWKKIGNGLY